MAPPWPLPTFHCCAHGSFQLGTAGGSRGGHGMRHAPIPWHPRGVRRVNRTRKRVLDALGWICVPILAALIIHGSRGLERQPQAQAAGAPFRPSAFPPATLVSVTRTPENRTGAERTKRPSRTRGALCAASRSGVGGAFRPAIRYFEHAGAFHEWLRADGRDFEP